MDLHTIVVSVAGALAGPGASVWVARITAGRSLGELEKRIGRMDDRLTAIETTEPEVVAHLRRDVDAIGADMVAVRGAVERLTAAHEKLVAAEERRRERAAERAERREEREREQDRSLAAKIAELGTLVRTLMEELRDVRSKLR